MATDDRLNRYQEAVNQAHEHRQKAGEYFADHTREQDPDKKQSLLTNARKENELAEVWEKKAGEIPERSDSSKHKEEPKHPAAPSQAGQEKESTNTETREKQADPTNFGGKRAWYSPGSVADDLGHQISEANQGGGLIADSMKYSARSVLDKSHRHYEGAKMLGKLAKAPVKATGAAYRGARPVSAAYQSHEAGEQAPNRNSTRDNRGPRESGSIVKWLRKSAKDAELSIPEKRGPKAQNQSKADRDGAAWNWTKDRADAALKSFGVERDKQGQPGRDMEQEKKPAKGRDMEPGG